jgi:hypothetical protein
MEPMETEPVRTEPAANTPEDEARVEPAVDRDRLALETLEGELAVLEDELARVDADRSDPTRGEHR